MTAILPQEIYEDCLTCLAAGIVTCECDGWAHCERCHGDATRTCTVCMGAGEIFSADVCPDCGHQSCDWACDLALDTAYVVE